MIASRHEARGNIVSINRSVLVTGATGGIGKATVRRLAASGWTVFAGVRDLAAGATISRQVRGNVIPVELDVATEDSVARASDVLDEHLSDGLDGLVNNAGILVGGPVECLTAAEVRRQFEVNVFGAVEVTRAFLPQLRKARGRVVNIGSVTGRTPIPYLGASGASKAALIAFNDVLRAEMRPFDVAVSIVEPGPVQTSIFEKGGRAGQQSRQSLAPEVVALYEPGIAAVRTATEEGGAAPTDAVGAAIERALTDRRPKTRYLVGKQARSLSALRFMPDRARDGILARELGLRKLTPEVRG
jgi:NAD(P)-dependent dehydrogenase (short-subunit alcohol dehydrogenase family)